MTSPTPKTPKKRARGFSLLEISVAMALVSVFAALSLPMVSRTLRRNELRRSARTIQASLQRARSLAISGKRSSTSWAATERTLSAGVRVTAANTMQIFIDRNSVNDGDEVTITTITLPRAMVLDTPAAGQELRFRQDGTVLLPLDFVVRDQDLGQTRTITLTAGGLARLQ